MTLGNNYEFATFLKAWTHCESYGVIICTNNDIIITFDANRVKVSHGLMEECVACVRNSFGKVVVFKVADLG